MANETEIEALRYISVEELNDELGSVPETFTPWFKMEWERLNSEFGDQIGALTACSR